MLGVGEKEVEVVNTLPTGWEKCFSGAAVVQGRDTPHKRCPDGLGSLRVRASYAVW